VALADVDMPMGDGFCILAAHRGEGMFLLDRLDPSVVDEGNPTAVEPRLDMYDTRNGYRPMTEGPSRSLEGLPRRVSGLSSARCARLDRLALDACEEAAYFRAKLKAAPPAERLRLARHAAAGCTVVRADSGSRRVARSRRLRSPPRRARRRSARPLRPSVVGALGEDRHRLGRCAPPGSGRGRTPRGIAPLRAPALRSADGPEARFASGPSDGARHAAGAHTVGLNSVVVSAVGSRLSEDQDDFAFGSEGCRIAHFARHPDRHCTGATMRATKVVCRLTRAGKGATGDHPPNLVDAM
jgi:hypothetical protein